MASSKIVGGKVTRLLEFTSITQGSTYNLSDSIENYDLVLVVASGYSNYYSSIYASAELMSRNSANHWVAPIDTGYGLSFCVPTNTQIKITGKAVSVSAFEVYGIRL